MNAVIAIAAALAATNDGPVPRTDGTSWSTAGAEPVDGRAAKAGRNDPCPCGSGAKYKKCCIATHKAEWPTPPSHAAQAAEVVEK